MTATTRNAASITGTPRASLAHGRWPVTAVFFLNGLALATYIVRLASIKDRFGFSNGDMGLIGVLFAVAAIAAMQFVGRLVARYGSARIITPALLAMPLTLVGMGLAESRIGYAVAATVLGAVHGTLDVAMNAHAVVTERRLGRPIISGCHAAWSISAVTASLTGAALTRLGASVATHLIGAGVVVALAGLVLGRVLAAGGGIARNLAAGDPAKSERSTYGWREGWSRSLVGLGLTGTALMVCEGAALGWSAIFLHESRGTSLALAATAVTAFTASQTVVRLMGDPLRRRYATATLFRIGALVASAGFAVAVFVSQPHVAVAGFGVVGVGTALLVPLAFSAVGHAAGADRAAATFLARFTTFTYAGILIGPGLIGWVAQVLGLTWTLAATIPLLACVALVTRLPGPSKPGAQGDSQPGGEHHSATADVNA